MPDRRARPRVVVVERSDDGLHQAAVAPRQRVHLRALGALPRPHGLDVRVVVAPRCVGAVPAIPVARHGALEAQALQQVAGVHDGAVGRHRDATHRKRLVGRRHRVQNGAELVLLGHRRADEVLVDARVLRAAEQDGVRLGQSTSRSADLLVVRDDGGRLLEVHDEAEVGLVEAHAEGHGGHERLELVAEQPALELLALLVLQSAVVRSCVDAASLEPSGHPIGVGDGQGVDDPRAGQPGHLLGEPREALGLRLQADGLQAQALAGERPAQDVRACAHLLGDIGRDARVGRRRGGEHGRLPAEEVERARQQPVFRAEVVPPVGDAVGLVDDHQRRRAAERRHDVAREGVARQLLRRGEEDVDLSRPQPCHERVAVRRVVEALDRQPEAQRSPLLVAHQRQQRTDDERRSGAAGPQQRRGHEVDDALAPARALHHQHARLLLHQGADRLELAGAEARVRAYASPQVCQCGGLERAVSSVSVHAGQSSERTFALDRTGRSRWRSATCGVGLHAPPPRRTVIAQP
jgi:hypothetical protein